MGMLPVDIQEAHKFYDLVAMQSNANWGQYFTIMISSKKDKKIKYFSVTRGEIESALSKDYGTVKNFGRSKDGWLIWA